MSKERYLVLGSNSNAGNHFVSHCIKNKIAVFSTSRSEMNSEKYLADRDVINAPYLKLDINENLSDLIKIITDFKPTIVINFSSQSMVAESWENPQHWIKTNISSTLSLYQILAKQSLSKYIHFSTPEVYGNASGEVNEMHFYNPSTPYAVTRACGDMFAKIWCNQYNLPIVITRAANVYGEGQKLYRIIPKTIYSLQNGIKIPLHGGGLTRRSFIHSADVAQALEILSKKGIVGETYHIVGENYLSIRQLVEIICNKMGFRFDDVIVVGPERPGKDLDYSLSCLKLKKLDWYPNISLESGIVRMISWFKKNQNKFDVSELNYNHTA
jgi:dTDP-glucose 4,6-dehydratase